MQSNKLPKWLNTVTPFSSLVALVLFIALPITAFWLGKEYQARLAPNNVVKMSTQNTVERTPPISQAPVKIFSVRDTSKTEPLFTGKIKALADLGILKPLDPSDIEKPSYYEAGTFASGKYKDYKRVLVLQNIQAMRECTYNKYFLATRDYKSYILDSTSNDLKDFDTSKVTSTDTFETAFDDILSLDTTFSLFKRQLVLLPKSKTTDIDMRQHNCAPILSLSSYTPLKSPYSDMKFYASPKPMFDTYTDMTTTMKQEIEVNNLYISSTTEMIVTDSTGLAYTYVLTTPTNIEAYKQSLMSCTDSNNPNCGFNSPITISNVQSTQPLFNGYKAYHSLSSCTSQGTTAVVTSLDQGDLKRIGTSQNLTLYTLLSAEHPLVHFTALYKKDFHEYTFKSEEDYKKMSPLLFFKDYWNRWVMLEENQTGSMGMACG